MDDTISSFSSHRSGGASSDRARIKDWSVDDRPREKLLSNGKAALTDAELLAIIIGSGNREETAVALMQRILKDVDYNLNQLGTQTVQELMRFKGIGEAKAISIVAMLELGRRRQLEPLAKRFKIESSVDSFF
jgi:DNA repair protein RadC